MPQLDTDRPTVAIGRVISPYLSYRRGGWPIQHYPQCLLLRVLNQQDYGPDEIQITFMLRCDQKMSCQ